MARPAIPEDVKRTVRQECYFGCAICGMPFFEYDHIEEYSLVKEHAVANLVLLCPNHHAAKTTGKLSVERLVEARANPANADRGHSKHGFSLEPTRVVEVFLGSNSVECSFPDGNGVHQAIWINGKNFFLIHSDNYWLTVSILLTDGVGTPILIIDKGEIVISTRVWDYSYEGRTVRVRHGLGQILLQMELSDSAVKIQRGAFLDRTMDGFLVEDDQLSTIFAGNVITEFVGVRVLGGACGGGWGVLNSRNFPDVGNPGGFGVFSE